jgi:hypothetical protein
MVQLKSTEYVRNVLLKITKHIVYYVLLNQVPKAVENSTKTNIEIVKVNATTVNLQE